MDCVVKKTLVRWAKPSLFTRSPEPRTEEPDTVYYEPTLACCLRLSQVLPYERNWNYCLN